MALPQMSVIEFCNLISTTEECIKFLREYNLIAKDVNCIRCSNSMSLVDKPLYVTRDGQQWACHKCRTTLTIRKNSVFEVSICQKAIACYACNLFDFTLCVNYFTCMNMLYFCLYSMYVFLSLMPQCCFIAL